MLVDKMIDSAAEVSYKMYVGIGATAGVFFTAIFKNLDDIVLAFLVGAASALGAAIVKYGLDKLKNCKKKREREEARDELESLVRAELERIERIKNESK